jgi:hypothetical protein
MPKPKSDKSQSKSEKATSAPQESKLLAVVKRNPEPSPEAEAPVEVQAPATEETQETQLLLVKPPARETIEQSPESAVASNTKTEIGAATTDLPLKSPERPKRVISTPVSGGSSGSSGDYSRAEQKPYKKSFDRKPQQPPYKKLETVTNEGGESFVVGEKILVGTSNFGEYSVVISFIYQAPDGSIWASYSPAGEEDQKHPWRWGCCRIEGLKKDLASTQPDSVS